MLYRCCALSIGLCSIDRLLCSIDVVLYRFGLCSIYRLVLYRSACALSIGLCFVLYRSACAAYRRRRLLIVSGVGYRCYRCGCVLFCRCSCALSLCFIDVAALYRCRCTVFLSISLALCFIDVVGAVPMVVALSVCWRLLFVGALLLALVDGVVCGPRWR